MDYTKETLNKQPDRLLFVAEKAVEWLRLNSFYDEEKIRMDGLYVFVHKKECNGTIYSHSLFAYDSPEFIASVPRLWQDKKKGFKAYITSYEKEMIHRGDIIRRVEVFTFDTFFEEISKVKKQKSLF